MTVIENGQSLVIGGVKITVDKKVDCEINTIKEYEIINDHDIAFLSKRVVRGDVLYVGESRIEFHGTVGLQIHADRNVPVLHAKPYRNEQ